MASPLCRRPIQASAARVIPIASRKVSPLSLEEVVQAFELLGDLEALAHEGLVISFSDQHDVERYLPKPKEIE